MTHRVIETNTIIKTQDVQSHPYINQYELLSTLGEGMHGKVMLALDKRNKTKVAIKVMKRNDPHNRRLPKSNRLGGPPLTAQQETESKIRREIAVMKKCSHQNLVRLLEVIDDPTSKKVYLVMENLEGGEVKWRNKNLDDPVLELKQIQRIMRDVTLGLEYLHYQGIIHRDIKPANLLWTADRQSVKICDFGVSHFAAAADQRDPKFYDEAGLTKTAGSPAFFAPEICHIPNFSFDDTTSIPSLRRGSNSSALSRSPSITIPPITKQIDIWALGVTFYCLLFGKPPWQGQTEFAMFRAICNEDFPLPDTMARDRIPTGGKDHKPEGKEIGWCVVDLLYGLLEKDQDKRITLADIKRIPWIQNGVREPERWLHETAPNTETRVVVTDEDTQSAIKKARFFYPGWMARITSTIKRVPLPLIPSSRTSSKNAADSPMSPISSSGSRKKNYQTESLSTPRSSRTRSVMERHLKRFTSNNGSPTRSNTDLGSRDRRRNSSTGITTEPTSHADQAQINRRSIAVCSNSWGARRQSDTLQPPAGPSRNFFRGGSSSASISPTSSPTTPDDHSAPGSRIKMRLSQVIRSSSMKKAVKGVRRVRSNQADGPKRTRKSAETFDNLRPSEEASLTQGMRASSWGAPVVEPSAEDEDMHTSFDLTTSEAGGTGTQDFNRSVVRFGAGGYVDNPHVSGISNALDTPIANESNPAIAGMTHSDSSSNSTATANTPHASADPQHHPPRVTSPLARRYDSDDGELSSDVFEDTGTDDFGEEPDSSDDDVLELRTRRPSAVLSRSANASPLR